MAGFFICPEKISANTFKAVVLRTGASRSERILLLEIFYYYWNSCTVFNYYINNGISRVVLLIYSLKTAAKTKKPSRMDFNRVLVLAGGVCVLIIKRLLIKGIYNKKPAGWPAGELRQKKTPWYKGRPGGNI